MNCVLIRFIGYSNISFIEIYEGIMKNNFVFLFILVAAICLLLGFIEKLTGTKLFVRGFTWHELSQTFLLFAIAWGIWKNFGKEVK